MKLIYQDFFIHLSYNLHILFHSLHHKIFLLFGLCPLSFYEISFPHRGAYPNLCLSGKPLIKIREFGAKSGTKRDKANLKKRHQFLFISLKALIKSAIQLLETNKLGIKYETKPGMRTGHTLFHFLKLVNATKSHSLFPPPPLLPPTKKKTKRLNDLE